MNSKSRLLFGTFLAPTLGALIYLPLIFIENGEYTIADFLEQLLFLPMLIFLAIVFGGIQSFIACATMEFLIIPRKLKQRSLIIVCILLGSQCGLSVGVFVSLMVGHTSNKSISMLLVIGVIVGELMRRLLYREKSEKIKDSMD